MTKKNLLEIQLARYFDESGTKQTVTIKDYQDLVASQNKDAIADLVYNRLHSRYLKPFMYKDKIFKKEYKNGFSIMANCCLLIETLQSFKNGWGDSDRRSGQAFKEFFSTDKNFTELKTKGREIYENVRCGILHQGETCRGWSINRDSKELLTGKTIHAVTFAGRLEKALQDYRQNLKTEKWDSELWDNLRTKMRKVIANCQ